VKFLSKINKENYVAFFICFLFFIAYLILILVKHFHFGTGYDLSIVDQIVWKYSQFKAPITSIQFYPFTSLLTDHVELIYILIAPFYWFYNNVLTLLVLQTLLVSFSGIPIYFLARKKGINLWLSFSLLVSYLMFYGIQNALWSDAHSLAFGASFLAWLIYFLNSKNMRWIFITFFLTIICKEDMAFLTLLIGFIYFLIYRNRTAAYLVGLSLVYLFAIFYVYFPHFTHDGYRYMAKGGLFSDLNVSYYYDSFDKRSVIFYSVAWFGLLPLLAPLFLLPAFGDVTHYFIFGHLVTGAQGLFEHYRITLAPLLVLPTIIVISKYKRLNTKLVATYIIIFALIFQYVLHLPLSYLGKKWFWHEPEAVKNIQTIIKDLPKDASVVSQNNIIPHIAHRDQVFTLWPDKKNFTNNSPCGKLTCNWFRWAGKPEFLVVDTASDWDIRHLLANRPDFIDGLNNLKKQGIIKQYRQSGTTTLYKIIKIPD